MARKKVPLMKMDRRYAQNVCVSDVLATLKTEFGLDSSPRMVQLILANKTAARTMLGFSIRRSIAMVTKHPVEKIWPGMEGK